MTIGKTIKTLLCATAMTCAAGFAWAEDKSGENAMAGADGNGGAVAQAAMAQDLYAYSVEKKNAVAALAAAQILMSLDIKDVERDVENKANEGDAVAEEGEGVDTPVDAAMMLASAKEFAGGDEALMGLIEDAEAEGSRGRIGGASRTLSRLRAGRTDVFKVPFYGSSLAEVAIVGDGDANLDVLITDENGNTICIDRSYSDKVYCSFTPRWDGYFYIAVVNQGRVRNSYYLLTN